MMAVFYARFAATVEEDADAAFFGRVLCSRAMLIVHNRHFRRSVAQGFDNLFKHTCNLIAIGGIPTLGADVGRNVLDDNDVISEVNHECGFFSSSDPLHIKQLTVFSPFVSFRRTPNARDPDNRR